MKGIGVDDWLCMKLVQWNQFLFKTLFDGKMCSTGLNACNLGYGVSVHKSAIVVMVNTGKTVQMVR